MQSAIEREKDRLGEMKGSGSASSFGDLMTGSDDDSLIDDYDQVEVGDLDMKDMVALRRRLKGLVKRLQKRATPRRIKARDKLTFMLGTVLALLCAYWLGYSPRTFYRVYTIAAVVLFSARFVIYRRKRWHYYFLDFCYWANGLLLVHIWIFPESVFLHKATFAYGAGPLSWSIIAFRNSLVFHSLDKITSLFLHMYPACVAWTERWHPAPHVKQFTGASVTLKAEWQNATMTEVMLFPMVPYLLWAVLYYAKIFIVSQEKIRLRGYETLYTYSLANPKSALARFVNSVNPQWQPLVYMSLHIFLTAATFAVSKIWWSYYGAHTAFLLFCLAVSAWNGASYYFDVFAHRYVAGLDTLLQEPEGGSPTRSGRLASGDLDGVLGRPPNGKSPLSPVKENTQQEHTGMSSIRQNGLAHKIE